MTSNHTPDFEKGAMRVWGVFRYFQPNFSGAATQGLRLLSKLAQQGYRVEVLAAAILKARFLAGTRSMVAGLDVRYLPIIQTRDWQLRKRSGVVVKILKSANRMLSNMSFNLKVNNLLRQEGQPGDVLLWFTFNESTILALRGARRRGIRTVIRLSMMGSDDPASYATKRRLGVTSLRHKALQECDAIVSLSSALRQSCLQAGILPHKVWYIPNGIDLEKFQPIPIAEREQIKTVLHLPLTRRIVLFVGSAKHRKGIDVLVHAFMLLAKEITDTDLVIVGPDDFSDHTRHPPHRQALVKSLKGEIAEAGLGERVHWVGEVQNVHAYLQAADVFCFPSRREGLPTAVIEAMACGLPVVASRLEGITTDLITHEGDGLLLASHDPEDYAQAMKALLSNRDLALRLGENARRRAEKHFSLETAVLRYRELFSALSMGG